ncbi:zinc ribbon domain-containing protein [Entomospira entomophila]|uniref:zinc ribbon domain-containing protein n=1 Tax=Entomospira entomophila TaxID=2719988 RepID=UPI001BAE9B61|nr:zinc ribbon domain-containing protein [Entomospira entomophilus]WDI35465.1 zinc ribbon domain-containing protein [Entomospira entomophilus]
MGTGIGLSMGLGLGQTIGNEFSSLAQSMNIGETKKCRVCKAETSINQQFCYSCGSNLLEHEVVKEKSLAPSGEQTIPCNQCGYVYSSKFKFCP